MTGEQIAAVAGIVLSLLFEYIPGLNTWYNALSDNWQRFVMLVLIFLIPVGMLAFSCFGWVDTFSCDSLGVRDALWSFVLALMSNQATHRILPRKA